MKADQYKYKFVIVAILLCISLFLAMKYIFYYYSTPILGDVSHFTGGECENLSVLLEKTVYSTKTDVIPLHISNNTNSRITYNCAGLEKENEGRWYKLKFRPYEKHANDLLLKPMETTEINPELACYGSRLQPGHYRWVIVIYSPDSGYVTAEFDIE